MCPAVFSRRSAVTNDLVTKKCDFAKKVKFRSYQKKAKKSDFAHLAALNFFFLDAIFHLESIEVTSRLVSIKLLGVNDHFSSLVPDFWYTQFHVVTSLNGSQRRYDGRTDPVHTSKALKFNSL